MFMKRRPRDSAAGGGLFRPITMQLMLSRPPWAFAWSISCSTRFSSVSANVQVAWICASVNSLVRPSLHSRSSSSGFRLPAAMPTSSGACTVIPNLSASERVPQRHAARAFMAKESNGFVHVWVGDGEPGATLPSADYSPTGREYTGSAVVSMTHDEYLAVMLDGPNCLLSFDAVQMTDFFLGDPQLVNDRLVLDRGAVWSSQILPSQFVADYPLIVRTAVPLHGGTIRVDLLSQDETPLSTLFISASANRRGTTSLCWRGFQYTSSIAGAPLRWRASRTAGRAPFSVNATIDGSAIAALLVAPSRDLHELRQQTVVEQRLVV